MLTITAKAVDATMQRIVMDGGILVHILMIRTEGRKHDKELAMDKVSEKTRDDLNSTVADENVLRTDADSLGNINSDLTVLRRIALNDAMEPFLISKIGLEALHENLSCIRVRQIAAINFQINLRDRTLKSTSTRTMRTT